MKKFIKTLLYIIFALLFIFLIFLTYSTITRYKPAGIIELSSFKEMERLDTNKSYTALIWNIGYCGLGQEADFFYDGGKNVRDIEDNVRRNLYKISEFLQSNDTIDFILLQEVDINSSRSYHINQVEHFNKLMKDHLPYFAYNYSVKFVPVPFNKPLGKVESGLLTLTKHIPVKVTRYSFPGNYSWPKSIFMLNRCFLVNRYPTNMGNEVLLINTHNSAYDNGELRHQQMIYLKEFITAESKKGNFVLVGGDWNQCPPGFEPEFSGELFDTINYSMIEADYLSEKWQWIYIDTIPSNRRIMIPYKQGETLTTVIDYFLSSPGIVVEEYYTIDLDFAWSDHQPVVIRFSFSKK